MMMTQYDVKKGIIFFGKEKEEATVDKELNQLHNMKGIEPTSTLTREKKRASLVYLIYLKKKKGGEIKGRCCDDGMNQQKKSAKGESSSSAVKIESAQLICIVEAEEEKSWQL